MANANSLSQLALQKFKKNFWGVLSFWFVVLGVLLAIFAYALAPDNSQNANQQHISIHSKKPGFKATILTIPSKLEQEQSFLDKLLFGKEDYVIGFINAFYMKYYNNLSFSRQAFVFA